MPRYYVRSVLSGISENPIAFAEIRVQSDIGEVFFLSLYEKNSAPSFYRTNESIFAQLLSEGTGSEDCRLEIRDYNDVFALQSDELYPLFRILIQIVRSNGAAEILKECSSGKSADELSIEKSDVEIAFEEAWDTFVIPGKKDELYRLRLALETDVSLKSIFHDLDPESYDFEMQHLFRLEDACKSEEDYLAWKEPFLDAEMQAISALNVIVCNYVYRGSGQYEMIMLAEELDGFQGWINASGYGFVVETRPANTDELRTYAALAALRD